MTCPPQPGRPKWRMSAASYRPGCGTGAGAWQIGVARSCRSVIGHARSVTSRAGAFAFLEDELLAPGEYGLDRLRLVEAPFVPEIHLHLAEDAIVWWARMEAETGGVMT